MRKLKLFFACLLMAVLSIGQVWANDVSFSKSDFSWTSTQSSGNPVSATKDGITITCTKANIPSGSYMVFNKDGVLAISSTAGNITAIDFTCTADDYIGNMTDVSNISTTNWSTTVSCTGSKTTVRVTSIVVTVSGESPTLSSIQVSTPPSKVTYTEGESFDPTGLVITRNFDNSTNDTYTYADHTSEFSFDPSTALTTSNTSVTITYGGKSTSQDITVNAAGGGGSGSGDDETDVLTSSDLTATTTNYVDFSGVTKNSDAVYAGSSAKTSSGGIQLRSKNSNSGIITTTSGGVVKSVTITVESGSNTIDIYGSNSAYESVTDLFGNNAGTKVGSLSATGTVTFTDDYAYVGIRSNNGAVYLTSVEIEWTPGSGDAPTPVAVTGVSLNKTSTSLAPNEQETLIATVAPNNATNKNVSWSTSNSNVATVTNGTVTAVAAGTATITVTTEDGEKTATCAVTVVKGICFDFEDETAHRTSGNNSYAEGPQEYEQHNSSISCSYMDVVTSGSPLAGSANALGRVLKATTNSPVLLLGPINIGGKKITGVSYLTKGVGAMSQTCSYSLNNSDWEELLTIESMPTQSTKESVSEKNITGTNLYLKIATTVASSTNSDRDLQIDNVILYYDDVTYSIAFDANGGTGTMNPILSIVYNASQTLTANTFTREGYEFAGWATSANGEKAYNNSATIDHVTGDMTLYAVWTAETYAITLDKNEGDSDGSAQATYDSNALAEITHAARSGWNLLGYFAATDGDVKIINADGTLESGVEGYTDNTGNWIKAADCTLYAHWEEIEDPIVTTNPTSVSFTSVAKEAEKPAAKTFVITGSNLTADLSLSAYVEADYYTWAVTAGSLEKDANGAVSATVTVTPKDDITEEAGDKNATITISGGGLEANVVVNVTFNVQETYTVNWYVNSNEPAHTQTAVAGTPLTDIPSVTPSDACADFTFEGWKVGAIATSQTTAPDYVDLENITMPEGGADYYAVFKEEGEVGKVTKTDELNRAFTGRPETTSYDTWTNKAGSASDAVYAGQSAGEHDAIQLRSNNSNSGIVTTTSGGKAKKVTVTWDTNTAATRTISIYGKNSVYSAATELYNNTNQGTLLGELCVDDAVSDISVLAIDGNYEYLGIRSKSGALYLAEVEIDWETEDEPSYTYVTTCAACSKVTFVKAGEDANNTFALQVNDANVEFVKTCDAGASVNVVASPADGYEMTNVEVTGVTGASYSDGIISIPQNATGTLTVTATFAPKTYSVTMAQEGGAAADISADQSGKHLGDEITVTAGEKAGFAFVGWTVSPNVAFAENYDAYMAITKFTMPAENVTVTAKYAQIYSVAEFAELEKTADAYYCVEGLVCQVNGFYSGKYITYLLSANGVNTGNIVMLYNGLGVKKADFTAAADLSKGDKVLAYGKWNSTNSRLDNSYQVSYLAREHQSYAIVGELTASSFNVGDAFDAAILNGLSVKDVFSTGYEEAVEGVTFSYGEKETWQEGDEELEVIALKNEEELTRKTFDVVVSSASVESIVLKADDNEYQTKKVYYVGEDFEAPKVIATLSDNNVIEVLASYKSGFDNTTPGEQDVVVSYTRGEEKTTTYKVTVKAIYNTLETAYDASEAKHIIENVYASTTESSYDMYVHGKVIADANSEGTYFISDDGNDANKVQIYKGKYFTSSVSASGNVKEGDEVIVKGHILVWSSAAEMKTTTVVSQLREPEFAFADIVAADEFEAGVSEDMMVVPTKNSGNAEFTMASSNPDAVTIVEGKLHAVAEGDAVITASRAATTNENELNYKAASTTFNVHVIGQRQRYTVSFDKNGGEGNDPQAIDPQLAGAMVDMPIACQYNYDGHGFTGWKVINMSTSAEIEVENNQFEMPEANVKIQAQWAVVAICRISFQVNGAEVAYANATQEAVYNIAQVGAAVEGFTWVGWSETENAEETTTKPTIITSYTPEAGEDTKNLFGIYSRVDESDPNYGKYVRATAVAEGDYLIVCEDYNKVFDGSLATLDATGNYQDVTITDGVVTLANADNYKFTLAAVTGGYSIRSASGKYIGCTGSGNGFNENATTEYVNTISIANEAFTVTSSGGPTLQYLNSGAQSRFRYYASNQKAIALYKKNTGSAKYTSSPVEKVTITFDADGGEGGCNKAIINKGGQLTICDEVPTKSQSDFAGWKNGDDVYVAGQTYTFNASITITAQWTEATPFAVTYNANGATAGDVPTIDAQYAGDQFSVAGPGNLVKVVEEVSYEFQGWKYDGKLYEAGDDFTMPGEAVEFVAQWKKSNIETDKMSLVTEASALATGMQVALGCSYVKNEENNFVMAGEFPENKKYMNSVTSGVTLSDGVATYTGDVVVMTLEQVEGGWKIAKNSTNYLTLSGGDIKWDTQANATVWTISFEGNNVKIATSTYWIQYNVSDTRFKTYGASSNMKAIQLFGKAIVVTEDVNISDLGYVDGEAIVASGEGVTVTIDQEINVQSITAMNGAAIEVEATTTAESLNVEGGATVTLNEDVTTPEFRISNDGSNSGQVIINNANNLHLSGAAYFDFTLEPGAEHAKYGYYAFCVPFPVNSNSGITTPNNDLLQDGVDYVLYYYDGAVRASGQYGWKRFHGTLNPGVFYMISLYADENGDCQYNTIRFKMEAQENGYDCMGVNATIHYEQYSSGIDNDPNAGWNGVGNPTLQNVKTTADEGAYNAVMQVYDREHNVFTDANAGSDVFKIGIPFFIQSSQEGDLAFDAETTPSSSSSSSSIAPRRIRGRETGRIRVNFGNETYTDHLYVSASEDALNSYELCKDMSKMSMGTAKVAQISSYNYGVNLLVEHAPLVNDQATYQLNLYAPAAGTYSISAQQVEGATLYVTYNGAIVWNLSLGDYELDLAKGTTTGYGLLLVVQPNQMPTGVENGELLNGENGVQKILLNGQLYILRDGHLYDAVGKEMK